MAKRKPEATVQITLELKENFLPRVDRVIKQLSKISGIIKLEPVFLIKDSRLERYYVAKVLSSKAKRILKKLTEHFAVKLAFITPERKPLKQ